MTDLIDGRQASERFIGKSSRRGHYAALAWALAASTAIGLWPASAAAQTVEWLGTTDNNWFDGTNWSSGAHPIFGDLVVINRVSPYLTVIDIGNALAGGIVVGGNIELDFVNETATYIRGTGHLIVGNGGSLSSEGDGFLFGDTIGLGQGGLGYLTVSGANSLYEVLDPDSITSVGILGGGGILAITGSGRAELGGLYLGLNGIGRLDVLGGGTLSTGSAIIGAYSSELAASLGGAIPELHSTEASATVRVFNPGSVWENDGELLVGVDFETPGTGAAQARVSVRNEGTIVTDGAAIGLGGNGSLDIDGGNFIVNQGGNVDDTSLLIGAAGEGSAVVSGANGLIDLTGGFSVGGYSSGLIADAYGSLLVTDGASFEADFDLENEAQNTIGVGGSGAIGEVTVTGAGSTLLSSARTTVVGASGGTGRLAVEAGGMVDVRGLTVGTSGGNGAVEVTGGSVLASDDRDLVHGVGTDGGIGSVLVSGAGSQWISEGRLYIGDSGVLSQAEGEGTRGSVVITDGGTFRSGVQGATVIGGGYGTGSVAVSGAGSSWTNSSESFGIGIEGGTGSLTVEDGGQVDIATSIGFYKGAIEVLSGGELQSGQGNSSYSMVNGLGGTASVLIGGAGSVWTNTGGLRIGTTEDADSLFTLAEGGIATVALDASIGTNGGTATLDIDAQSRMTVAGDLVQGAGSTYAVALDPAANGVSGFIGVTGTATIEEGAALSVRAANAGNFAVGNRYTVLTADGGVTGTYNGGETALDLSAFVGLEVGYDANAVFIDVERTRAFADVALTPNQTATANGAESLPAGNDLYDAILALPTQEEAREAFDLLSGEIHGSVKGMLIEDSAFLRDAMSGRLSAAFGGPGASPVPVLAYGPGGPQPAAADTERFALWSSAFGNWSERDGNGNAAAFDWRTGGFLIGADGAFADTWRVGLLGGYSHTHFDANARASSGGSDNYHIGLYAGTQIGGFALRSGASYTWHDISSSRTVRFAGFSDRLGADYDAATAQVFTELAYGFDAGRARFEPFAGLAYVNVDTDGFTETGGAAALTVPGSSSDATFTTLGLRASTDFAIGGVPGKARGMLGWRHAFGDTDSLSTHAFAGGDAFTVAGVPIAGNAAVIEAGLDFSLTETATFGVSYRGQLASHAQGHGVNARLDVKF